LPEVAKSSGCLCIMSMLHWRPDIRANAFAPSARERALSRRPCRELVAPTSSYTATVAGSHSTAGERCLKAAAAPRYI
jgi:hypothetical protein